MLSWLVSGEAVRRWIAGHRSAERRAFDLMKEEGPMTPELSFEAAMEMCDLASFAAHDPVRDREIASVRMLWMKLKQPWVGRRA